MNIVLIHRADLDKRPPVLSAAINIISLGHNLTIITTGVSDKVKCELEKLNVNIIVVKYKMHKNPFELIIRTIKYRNKIRKTLKKFSEDYYTLWIEGNYTISSLFGIFNKYTYYLQIQELYKNKIEYLTTKYVIKNAKGVFMPEYNRSHIYRLFFNLSKLPYILPNKPYFIPNENELDSLKNKYPDIVRSLMDKKIILYQGALTDERKLDKFLIAFNRLKEYTVVLLGKDHGVLSRYKKLNPDIIHIPFITAPDYLMITSLAYIGIVTYVPDTLNTIYCAPNKISEYTAFGIPILANDIPGLRYQVQYNDIGVVVNEENENDIISSFLHIVNNYSKYSSACVRYFNSIDNKSTIKKALQDS